MAEIHFVWDDEKAKSNRRKHDISFNEAKTAFYDEKARLQYDPDHSEDEDRFLLLGVSYSLRILVVSHCYREEESVIRIISARKATKNERRQYGEFLQ
jgi:hypothetical protein